MENRLQDALAAAVVAEVKLPAPRSLERKHWVRTGDLRLGKPPFNQGFRRQYARLPLSRGARAGERASSRRGAMVQPSTRRSLDEDPERGNCGLSRCSGDAVDSPGPRQSLEAEAARSDVLLPAYLTHLRSAQARRERAHGRVPGQGQSRERRRNHARGGEDDQEAGLQESRPGYS